MVHLAPSEAFFLWPVASRILPSLNNERRMSIPFPTPGGKLVFWETEEGKIFVDRDGLGHFHPLPAKDPSPGRVKFRYGNRTGWYYFMVHRVFNKLEILSLTCLKGSFRGGVFELFDSDVDGRFGEVGVDRYLFLEKDTPPKERLLALGGSRLTTFLSLGDRLYHWKLVGKGGTDLFLTAREGKTALLQLEAPSSTGDVVFLGKGEGGKVEALLTLRKPRAFLPGRVRLRPVKCTFRPARPGKRSVLEKILGIPSTWGTAVPLMPLEENSWKEFQLRPGLNKVRVGGPFELDFSAFRTRDGFLAASRVRLTGVGGFRWSPVEFPLGKSFLHFYLVDGGKRREFLSLGPSFMHEAESPLALVPLPGGWKKKDVRITCRLEAGKAPFLSAEKPLSRLPLGEVESGVLEKAVQAADKSKRFEEEKAFLEALLARGSESEDLLRKGASFYIQCPDPRLRDPKRAVELAEEMGAISGEEDPKAFHFLAWIYFKAGKPGKAVRVEEKALDLAPGNRRFLECLREYRKAAGLPPASVEQLAKTPGRIEGELRETPRPAPGPWLAFFDEDAREVKILDPARPGERFPVFTFPESEKRELFYGVRLVAGPAGRSLLVWTRSGLYLVEEGKRGRLLEGWKRAIPRGNGKTLLEPLGCPGWKPWKEPDLFLLVKRYNSPPSNGPLKEAGEFLVRFDPGEKTAKALALPPFLALAMDPDREIVFLLPEPEKGKKPWLSVFRVYGGKKKRVPLPRKFETLDYDPETGDLLLSARWKTGPIGLYESRTGGFRILQVEGVLARWERKGNSFLFLKGGNSLWRYRRASGKASMLFYQAGPPGEGRWWGYPSALNLAQGKERALWEVEKALSRKKGEGERGTMEILLDLDKGTWSPFGETLFSPVWVSPDPAWRKNPYARAEEVLAALEEGNLQALRRLLDEGVDWTVPIHGKDSHAGTLVKGALVKAVSKKRADLLEALLAARPPLDKKSEFAGIHLLLEAAKGPVELFTLLLDWGLSLPEKIEEFDFPGDGLHLLGLWGRPACIRAALQRGLGKEDIYLATALGDIEKVKAFLSKDPGLLDKPYGGRYRPLHFAVVQNDLEMVRFLLGKGAKARVAGEKLPLLCGAAARCGIPMVELLLGHGAKLTDKDMGGENPLFYAVLRKNLAMIPYLVKKGLDPNERDKGGLAPIHIAILCEDAQVVKALLESGASPTLPFYLKNSEKKENTWTPLELARNQKKKKIAALLEAWQKEHWR